MFSAWLNLPLSEWDRSKSSRCPNSAAAELRLDPPTLDRRLAAALFSSAPTRALARAAAGLRHPFGFERVRRRAVLRSPEKSFAPNWERHNERPYLPMPEPPSDR